MYGYPYMKDDDGHGPLASWIDPGGRDGDATVLGDVRPASVVGTSPLSCLCVLPLRGPSSRPHPRHRACASKGPPQNATRYGAIVRRCCCYRTVATHAAVHASRACRIGRIQRHRVRVDAVVLRMNSRANLDTDHCSLRVSSKGPLVNSNAFYSGDLVD